MNHEISAVQLVIDAFAELETGSAQNVVAQLNVGFAIAMGVKLEDTGAANHAMPDGVVVLAAADVAALLQSGAWPHHQSNLN